MCGDYIRNRLLEEIREAQFFGISANEVADREQMSLVVQFVDKDKNIREEFLGFVQCDSGTHGKSWPITYFRNFRTYNGKLWRPDIQWCRCNGRQCHRSFFLYLSVYPKALYTHCTSHILNHCIIKSLDLWIVKNMMGLADSIARFFRNSPKQQVALEMIWVGMTIQSAPNWK